MQLTLAELAAGIRAEIARGDATAPFIGVANLADAGPRQLAPYTSIQYLDQLKATRAGAILIKRGSDTESIPDSSALLISDDPEIAFLEAVRLFHAGDKPRAGIHPSASVDPMAKLGPQVHVGANATIEAEALIGANCTIMANAVIGARCEVGDDCTIYPNVTLYPGMKLGKRVVVHAGSVIGADGFGYKFRNGRHVKVPHVGWVELGDDVEVGANSCIDRGSLGPTRIGAGTKIDNLVQIAHNNTVGKHCIICGQVALAGSCTLEDYVQLGGNVGLADHASMGKGAKAGAKSGITGHVPAGAEVWGLFAFERNRAFKSYAALRRLPDLERRVKQLEDKNEKTGA